MPGLELEDLQVIDETLTAEHNKFASYISDPMMEGQPEEYFEVARKEVARLRPVIDKVRAMRLAL